MSAYLLIVSSVTLALVSGCASTNFAKTGSSATITEQRIKLDSASGHWGINKLVQVGDKKLGYYGPRGAKITEGNSGVTYTFDAGPTAITAWYFDNQTGSHLANQTPITKMQVNLKPQGRYELRSVKKDDKLQFMVVDLVANASIASSDWVSLSQQLLPEPAGDSSPLAVPGLFRLFR